MGALAALGGALGSTTACGEEDCNCPEEGGFAHIDALCAARVTAVATEDLAECSATFQDGTNVITVNAPGTGECVVVATFEDGRSLSANVTFTTGSGGGCCGPGITASVTGPLLTCSFDGGSTASDGG
ncbi:MAG TPA: hypothetical protein VGG39_05975 [Polyangiaceae bacterium]